MKQASNTLRLAIEDALTHLDLTITEYSCLELLRQRSDLTNSTLARGTFVTRQSMSVVLRRLEDRGLVVRPPDASVGRLMPARLTEHGDAVAVVASRAVRSVERRMTDALDAGERTELRRLLASCVAALTPSREPADVKR